MKKILYFLLMLVPVIVVAQDTITTQISVADNVPLMNHATKENADSAYIKGDYNAAISIYEAILSGGKESAEIYYNLGNAYYKNNEIAKAVLNYERALMLNPGDSDIRFNLELAHSKTVDKVSEGYSIFFVQWIEAVVNAMGMNVWCVVGGVAFIVLLLSLLLFFFNNRIQVRKVAFFVALAMLFITVFANIAAYNHYSKMTERDMAIITAPSVTAKSTPDDSGTNLFVIHEGRKVRVSDDSMSSWKEIELEDGTVGWIPASALEII